MNDKIQCKRYHTAMLLSISNPIFLEALHGYLLQLVTWETQMSKNFQAGKRAEVRAEWRVIHYTYIPTHCR